MRTRILILISIAGFLVILRVFFFNLNVISGPSMCPEINYFQGKCNKGHTLILISKTAYNKSKPEYGDIIVFSPANYSGTRFIKRIIGIPGDELKIEDGKIYKFDKTSDEFLLLNESGYLSAEINLNISPEPRLLTVPTDSYFVLGDNRKLSNDSENCFYSNIRDIEQCGEGDKYSFIPKENIYGKAVYSLWPVTKAL